MNISIWGTRGSLPSPGPETIHFGGNTPCVSVSAGNNLLILDAGSGIRRLGTQLKKYGRIDILLTHFHMDHIQGLGFFQPLYNPEAEIHIWGAVGAAQDLRSRLKRYLSPPLFPVRIRDLPCKLHLHEMTHESVQIGDFLVTADYVCHPSPTLGFRVQQGKHVLTYISDHELALGIRGFSGDPEWTSGYNLAAGADLLIHDAQYSPEEYDVRRGWGHSSIEHALKFAQLTKAKHLLLFHHDPAHTDQYLRELYEEYTTDKIWPFVVEVAAEGTSYIL